MARYSLEQIKDKTGRVARTKLIHLPTPLHKLNRLSVELGGPDIYVKRDDLTGQAFGGNKSRKLEFIIQDILEKKADVVITWGSLQSNWCLQLAAAARRCGIHPVLLLFNTSDAPPGYLGNVLLDSLLEGDIRVLEAPKRKMVKSEHALSVVEETAQEFRKEGRRPYLVPIGGSLMGGDMDKPLGAISYVDAVLEITAQAESAGVEVDYIVHATSSGGTQAGLLVGSLAVSEKCKIIGISAAEPKELLSQDVLEISSATVNALDLHLSISSGDIIINDDYTREGYGIATKEVADTIRFVFQQEGLVLDPVYTAKAMAGLIDLIRKGYFKKSDTVVFLHTGGTPALFADGPRILNLLEVPGNWAQ
jgi:D-cysteine desulfhydrase family pyridoxal phosphate-dependent enzyme